jgi:hypothetical protein
MALKARRRAFFLSFSPKKKSKYNPINLISNNLVIAVKKPLNIESPFNI